MVTNLPKILIIRTPDVYVGVFSYDEERTCDYIERKYCEFIRDVKDLTYKELVEDVRAIAAGDEPLIPIIGDIMKEEIVPSGAIKLLRISVRLNAAGLHGTKEEYYVEEKPKTYVAAGVGGVGIGRNTVKKSELLQPQTFLRPNVAGLFSYYAYCLPEQMDDAVKMLVAKCREDFERQAKTTDTIRDALKAYDEKKAIKGNGTVIASDN